MDTLPQEVLDLIDVLENSGHGWRFEEEVEAVKRLLPKPPEPIIVKVTRHPDFIGDLTSVSYPDGWDRVVGLGFSLATGQHEAWEVELRPIRRIA